MLLLTPTTASDASHYMSTRRSLDEPLPVNPTLSEQLPSSMIPRYDNPQPPYRPSQDLDTLHDDTSAHNQVNNPELEDSEVLMSSGYICHKRGKHGMKAHHHRPHAGKKPAFTQTDIELLNLALNLEYLEADFFLYAGYGYGLDAFNNTSLNVSGPAPMGGQKATLGRLSEHIAKEIGLQDLGHIREIQSKLKDKAIPRPQIDISKHVWAKLFNEAFGRHLHPPFSPYHSGTHFLLAAYMLPYVSFTAYISFDEKLVGRGARQLLAGLVGVKAAQDAAIRTILYQRRLHLVGEYNHTVSDFTSKLSALRAFLDNGGSKPRNHPHTLDEGVVVPSSDSPERLLNGNIISADSNSLSVGRTPQQVLQVLYGTGDASIPSLFYPEGANGRLASKYLDNISRHV